MKSAEQKKTKKMKKGKKCEEGTKKEDETGRKYEGNEQKFQKILRISLRRTASPHRQVSDLQAALHFSFKSCSTQPEERKNWWCIYLFISQN